MAARHAGVKRAALYKLEYIVTQTKGKIMKKILIIAIVILTTACNTPPGRIAPAYQTTTAKETGMSCKQLQNLKHTIDSQIVAERSELDQAANIDRGIVGGSIILLPIGLIGLAFTGTGDLPRQYSENLGKQRSIQELLIDKGC